MIFVDNIKNFLSKNIKLIISLLVIIGIGIIGYTLAAPKLTNVSIATGNYQVVYSGTATLPSSKLTPILDDELTSSSNSTKVMKVTFTVKGAQTNPTNVPIIYDVSLTDLNLASELHSELLKWRLYKNNTQISEGSFSYDFDAQINKRMVLTSIQQDLPSYSSAADSYTFYIWISEQCIGEITSCGEETNTAPLMNKTLSGNIKIELSTKSKKALTRRTGIQPNSPDLVQGLIPVKYDENKNTWVKADSSNTNFSWYDYSEKRWANAVLVSETGIDYPITSKSVSISNGAGVYSNTNQKKASTTSSTTFTITTGSTAGTISFNYTVYSESIYDKLIVTLNGTEKLNKSGNLTTATAFSMNVSANTTYTMIIKYTKDGSGDTGTDTATISNLTFPTGATVTITPDATYPFREQLNQKIGSKFTYDTSTSMYTLKDSTNDTISSSTVGKYVCPDISQTSCSTMYKVTESNTTITKVEEYGVPTVRSDIRSTYTNASEGTEIREDDILAFYVWIPRYKYRVWNISKQAGAESTYAYKAKTEGIDIVFEVGTASTGTINCEYNYNVDSANGGVDLSTITAETCTGSNGDYYTHPAFTFGSDNVKGFWIGKYEISSSNPAIGTYGGGNTTSLTVRILPNVTSWRNNKLSNFSTVILNMQTSNNIYGLSTSRTNTDSHMLTNFEWGAVAYLTNSKYGRCTDGSCTEVSINGYGETSYYTTRTGCGPISSGSASYGTTCNAYNTTLGQLASTTGNVTGVYDMSGGAYEYVMGNMSSVTTGYTFYPASSGFASNWYTTDTAKYLTTYAYDTVNNNQKAYNRGRLGDATAETLLSVSTSGGWYSDYAYFPYSSVAWFIRGGYFNNGSTAGVFYFGINNGYNYSNHSSRAALVSLSA